MIERMIQDVLDEFDFEKCHKTMTFLNWRWGLDGEIPTIERMKGAAKERIMSAIDGIKNREISHHSSYFSSSGGFKGTVWKNRYGHIEGVRLEFVLADWDSDGDY